MHPAPPHTSGVARRSSSSGGGGKAVRDETRALATTGDARPSSMAPHPPHAAAAAAAAAALAGPALPAGTMAVLEKALSARAPHAAAAANAGAARRWMGESSAPPAAWGREGVWMQQVAQGEGRVAPQVMVRGALVKVGSAGGFATRYLSQPPHSGGKDQLGALGIPGARGCGVEGAGMGARCGAGRAMPWAEGGGRAPMHEGRAADAAAATDHTGAATDGGDAAGRTGGCGSMPGHAAREVDMAGQGQLSERHAAGVESILVRLLKKQLLSLAEAIATHDDLRARFLLQHVGQEADPLGSPMQRAAFHFVRALSARATGTGHVLQGATMEQELSGALPCVLGAPALRDFLCCAATHALHHALLPALSRHHSNTQAAAGDHAAEACAADAAAGDNVVVGVARRGGQCSMERDGTVGRVVLQGEQEWQGSTTEDNDEGRARSVGESEVGEGAEREGSSLRDDGTRAALGDPVAAAAGAGEAAGDGGAGMSGSTGRFPLPPPPELVKQVQAAARALGLRVAVRVVRVGVQGVTRAALGVREGEVVLVRAALLLQQLCDASVIRANPRDSLLQAIHALRPLLVVVTEQEAGLNSPFFLTRFQAALDHYSAWFDCLAAPCCPLSDAQRSAVEARVLGADIANIVACEGINRLTRPEPAHAWHARATRLGFEVVAMGEEAVEGAAAAMGASREGLRVEVRHGVAVLEWKGCPLLTSFMLQPSAGTTTDSV
ncbi:hypothetical protein CLOP_g6296 [Closterium sp. NIES-67]|nr:hypothetical protein CLOP_g6296 [Closterium sp. NIES-67]